MLRHRDQLLTPPHSLRRRQQTQHSEAGPLWSEIRSGNLLHGSSNDVLDLSICHPRQFFSIRFSALATPPPSSVAKPSSLPRDLPTTNTRRTRNSRGTKEAKKRRDMRRNRRKMAAQFLDQQISQAVDETLTRANFPAPPPPRTCLLPAISASMSTMPTAGLPLPQPAHMSSMPPELPLPEFSAFDLSTFPHLAALPSTPLPPRTPTPFRNLPKWCPRIPSLTLGDVWRDCLPTFYDLSSLPEPVETQPSSQDAATGACKDLQVWRPTGASIGRERSRFFPPRSFLAAGEQGFAAERKTRVARVKLPPPVGCRLHEKDEGVNFSFSTPKSIITQAAIEALAEIHGSFPDRDQNQYQQYNTSRSYENNVDAAASVIASSYNNVIDEATYDALWSVFASATSNNNSFANANHVQPDTQWTFKNTPEEEFPINGTAIQYDPDQLPPYELDACETALPYVHANSLVGYSNGAQDTMVSSYHQWQTSLVDSGVDLPVVRLAEDEHVGLNELVVDHDIPRPADATFAANVPLPFSLPPTPPATPPTYSIGDIAALLPIDCVIQAEYHNSDAHYYSEQALFAQSTPSPAQSTATLRNDLNCGSINIAEFLKLGHAKQCWCGYCAEDSYSDTVGEAGVSSSSSVTLAGQDHSVSDFDDDKDLPELVDPVKTFDTPASLGKCCDEIIEDDGWLLCPPLATDTAQDRHESTPPLYLPSSPILHRQRQPRSSTPTIIITSSDHSADNQSDDYIAVPPPATSSAGTSGKNPTWAEMFPRRPSPTCESGLTKYGEEGIGRGFANAIEGSWRWARESEEEWWDWAVEEQC